MTDSPIARHSPPKAQRGWERLFWILVVLVGAGYVLVGYAVFDIMFSGGPRHKSGVMALSFLVALPFSLSAVVVYKITRHKERRFWRAFFIALTSLMLAIILSILIFGEGIICILLAVVPALMACLIGAIIGWCMSYSRKRYTGRLMSIGLLLPFVLGAWEHQMVPPDHIATVTRSVYINAPAQNIWQEILSPDHIRSNEVEGGIAYRIGVPVPLSAQMEGEGVGAIRHSAWGRGVMFDEEVVAWEENRYIAWKYHFRDDSFPSGSLDDHIKVGGTYFDLMDTSYRLTPKDGGTQLDISIRFRITTGFNWYAGLIGDTLIGDTAMTLLEFYRKRTEV